MVIWRGMSLPSLPTRALPIACGLLALTPAVRAAADAGADTNTDPSVERLDEVEIIGSRVSALSQAPTDSPLDVVQPQSAINLPYISNAIAPTADFATIANIAPSVSNVETNGPGLSESKHLTLRGFDDAQYNVTFDGIPFGDINDFSHHTTSYFPAKLLGRVVVDRGPGQASTIGEATFGGTVALSSKDPRADFAFIPTLSYGSWNTELGHFEINSGVLPALGGASAIASYQRMQTDGYRSNSDMWRDTYYVKYLQPVGANTRLTFLSSYNNIHFSNPGTLTQSQIDAKGRDYGLGSDPTQTDYNGYNYQDKQADFEYIGLESRIGAWTINDKLYTYYYNNESHEKPKAKTVSGTPNILGSYKVNLYRTYGNTLSASLDTGAGVLNAGIWIDYSRNPRYLYGLNYTATGVDAVDTNPATALFAPVAGNPYTASGQPGYNYSYDMVDYLRTWQPFVEYRWRPLAGLTIEPGVKYVSFTRNIEAKINQTKGRLPLYYQHTATKTLPYLSANYTVDGRWSVYGQAAEGMLAPNLNQFYVDSPTDNVVKPAQTWNYQTGVVYKTDHLNASADAYYIDFKNYAYKGPTDSSGDPLYYGVAKGAYYSGVEAEATWSVGGGVGLYANGSLNRARFKGSKLDVPTVPESTAALGLVYDGGGFFGSFTGKYVGSWTVYDDITNPDVAGGGASRTAKSDSYWIGDLSVGYGQKLTGSFIRSFKVRFQIGNVFDSNVQVLEGIDSNPANAYSKDTFNVLPGRNYFLTLSAEF